ncbi:MAG: hypothetical protein ABJB97_13030 [Acidobacteriota bacterium]
MHQILDDSRTQLHALRKESEPRFDEIQRQADERMQKVLTAEQWKQFQQERETMRGRGRRGRDEGNRSVLLESNIVAISSAIFHLSFLHFSFVITTTRNTRLPQGGRINRADHAEAKRFLTVSRLRFSVLTRPLFCSLPSPFSSKFLALSVLLLTISFFLSEVICGGLAGPFR